MAVNVLLVGLKKLHLALQNICNTTRVRSFIEPVPSLRNLEGTVIKEKSCPWSLSTLQDLKFNKTCAPVIKAKDDLFDLVHTELLSIRKYVLALFNEAHRCKYRLPNWITIESS